MKMVWLSIFFSNIKISCDNERYLCNFLINMRCKMKEINQYNGPIISDHSSKNYREHGKIQQESEKETTP